jgi:hypothetical protein
MILTEKQINGRKKIKQRLDELADANHESKL